MIDDPSLYLHRPLSTDIGGQQFESDSFYVLAPVPNNLSNIDWEKCGDSFKDTVFNILEEFALPDLKKNLVDSFYITPKYFEEELNLHTLGIPIKLQNLITYILLVQVHIQEMVYPVLYLQQKQQKNLY